MALDTAKADLTLVKYSYNLSTVEWLLASKSILWHDMAGVQTLLPSRISHQVMFCRPRNGSSVFM